MTSSTLLQWIDHPEQLNRDTLYTLRTLLMRYPYFQSARLLYLKNLYLLHDEEFGAELRKAVPYVADRRMLFYLIEGGRYTLQPQLSLPDTPACEGEEPDVDRTLKLIDAFLAAMPAEPTPAEGLDYATDYTGYLLAQERMTESSADTDTRPTPPMRGQKLIDGFISRSLSMQEESPVPQAEEKSVQTEEPVPEPSAEAEEAPLPADEGMDDSCFTETLAKIYIKQHRYEKALAIIRKLSLNYPKKNAYFADQIRFLEKLIINAKTK